MLPENVHLDVMDGFVQVNDKEAFSKTREVIATEGICIGPSSAMALVGAIKWSEKLKSPANFLIMMPDSGRGYLSKVFNDEWMKQNGLL